MKQMLTIKTHKLPLAIFCERLLTTSSAVIRYAVVLAGLTIGFTTTLQAQEDENLEVFDYTDPQDYEIGGIKVTGAFFSDEVAIIGVSGLAVGDKIRIPGYDIPRALRNLWRLRLFTDVQIIQEKKIGDVIFLEYILQERPRLSRFSYKGVKKSFHDDLNDEVNRYLLKGGIVTEDIKVNASESIRAFFVEKGFLDTRVLVEEINDTSRVNAVRLLFDVDLNDKIKIKDIIFTGNTAVTSRRLRKEMETKEKRRFLTGSKFIAEEYDTDQDAIIAFYNKIGYRDARIIQDSSWRNEKGELVLRIDMMEGTQYFFRDIAFKGNSIYETQQLEDVLGITKGDVYNQELLETRLSFSQDGRDVSTLYMDNGYLFFRADPIETAIEGDSIDLEIRIFEGPQATIDKVTIAGNDRTHEHVIRRELRTRPGDKFSRSDIIRSQRQIINLNYFNPENLGINTPVNPNRGTVDIEYTVEEKPSDQLELSAGWGGQRRVIGTLGVTFNNFSLRNITNRKAWHPLPQGDGQRVSLRAQTNGDFYQSYNVSFTEPWLGGKKPTSLTVAGFYNRFTNGATKANAAAYQSFNITQFSVSVGTRLRWPDDNFVSRTGVNIQTLNLQNWSLFNVFRSDNGEVVRGGYYNNFSITQTLARSTINDPLFPKEGSNISLSVQFTPPYSVFQDRNYADLPPEDRYRWLEYHKWRFDADWYATLVGKLVLKAQTKFGIIGSYNNEIGTSPFERFQLGGDGINNQQFGYAGVDIISSRGYEIADFPGNTIGNGQEVATPLYSKLTFELRYPLSLNPSSTIYVLAFAQGANAWRNGRDFNPFELQRSVGGGVRVFLPMFGTLGFDYGIGIDKSGPRTLQNMGDFNIILGFEPE
ncbi:outer membrane protein assembly factor BamA [Lewinella sp. LCG006]|uniref:outer membrane protein assembly factor BamA n=1 Tax=Lewinella sp. LCG006 TaxID=3231911 RepID=UPI003460DD85